MPDPIKHYLSELERWLTYYRIDPDRIETVVKESESHLREAVAAHLRQGLDGSEAARAAVEEFGAPKRVANGHFQGARAKVLGLPPLWVALVGAFVAVSAWDFQFLTLHGYWDIFGESWMNGVAGVIGITGLVLFCLGASRRRRPTILQTLALTGLIVAAIPFLLSWWMIGSTPDEQGISRFHVARDVRNVRRNVAILTAYEGYFKEGLGVFEAARKPSDVSIDFREYLAAQAKWGISDALLSLGWLNLDPRNSSPLSHERYIVPGSLRYSMIDGRVWAIGYTNSLEKARKLWSREGSEGIDQVKRQRANMESLLRSVDEAKKGRLFFFDPEKYRDAIGFTILALPILILLDLAVFGLGLIRIAKRRDPVRA